MAFKRISFNQAKEKLNDPETILVDIRDSDSFIEGHIRGAIHLPQESLPLFVISTNKITPIMVMCYHGNSSQAIADFLVQQGFSEVYSIDGGYEGWGK
ncbi:thiosulfate sulfurtransferase GlpE [Prevotella sp. 10(H)]|uniref:thiosulfate sulfurtransferase GlpE n=1 Tax=Prevotella sp. 10(H) TaxID=1158294 RepID=UPI0004A756AF|nr:thiosulfate sulfurtransferase GlpE [Prevotella sp. 10(H)]